MLHVGASNPLRYWQAEKWWKLAEQLTGLGYQVVWTAAPAEVSVVRRIDPLQRYPAYSQLSFAQLRDLLARAQLLICPDTGVAHLAKITHTPQIVLFGQGSEQLFGQGPFFNRHPFFRCVIINDMSCRDQQHLFKRPMSWIRRCNRGVGQCANNRCMNEISVDQVYQLVLAYRRHLHHSR